MDDLKPVAGLNGVFVRTPPADLELMGLWTRVGGDDHEANARFRQRLVETCAVDATGNRLVPDGKIGERSMVWVERVAAVAGNVFGAQFSQTAHELAEKN